MIKKTKGIKKKTVPAGNRRLLFMIGGGVCLVLIVVLILAAVLGNADTAEGIAYLRSLEEQDMTRIKADVQAMERTYRETAYESGDYDIWSQFNDIVLCGDSRTLGFEQYGFLDANHIFAKDSGCLRNIPEWMSGIKAANPSYVIFCYGFTDSAATDYWSSFEEWCAELDDSIATIESEIPGCKVLFCQPIPVKQSYIDENPYFAGAPEWMANVEQYCQDTGIPWISIQDIVDTYDFYDPDGCHVGTEFYYYWADAILEGIYSYED